MTIDREQLGRLVRELWIGWANQQPNPKPSWLVSYDGLSEADKEADRVIGEGLMHEFFAATTGERLRVQRALQVLRQAVTKSNDAAGFSEGLHEGWEMVDKAVQILEGQK
jgi:hypothetical protein